MKMGWPGGKVCPCCPAIEFGPLHSDVAGMAKNPVPPRPDKTPMQARDRERLLRQFHLLRRSFPWLSGTIHALQSRRATLVRVPVAVLMILGGLVSFLPFLGIWMLPLGVMLLAIDIPRLQGPVAGLMIRVRRWWAQRRRNGRR